MKKQSNIGYVLRISLTLLLITSVVAALLAGVDSITAERIAALKKEKTDQAIAAVLPGEKYISDISSVLSEPGFQRWTSANNIEVPDSVSKIYMARSRPPSCDPTKWGVITGFAVEVVVTGFDGDITMMVGVDAKDSVLGISIISHTETAGLGAEAASNSAKGQAFREQFIGTGGDLAVTKDGGTIDGITGATITSRAVTEGVSTALRMVDLVLEYSM